MTIPATALRLHDRVEFLDSIANRRGIVFRPGDQAIITALYGAFCSVEDPQLYGRGHGRFFDMEGVPLSFLRAVPFITDPSLGTEMPSTTPMLMPEQL